MPTATQSYTLSLHDALPISGHRDTQSPRTAWRTGSHCGQPSCLRLPTRQVCPASERLQHGRSLRPDGRVAAETQSRRSEEHTSELQSPYDLVCRLLLEKKNK